MRHFPWFVPLCFVVGCSAIADGPAVETVTAAKPPMPGSAGNDAERLFAANPISFLETCLGRAERQVHGYKATLIKQERLNGKLGVEEQIDVCFQERPFSVLMEWKRGHKLARKTLYVDGEHDNRIVAQLAGWRSIVGQVTCAVDDPDAKATSRYPINEFGMTAGCRRSLASWKASQERGDLKVSLLGARKIHELDDRECWVVHRVESPGSDPEGIIESTYYLDTATGLQTGTVLVDGEGRLVGRYFFRDLVVNPTFDEKTFCRERMKK